MQLSNPLFDLSLQPTNKYSKLISIFSFSLAISAIFIVGLQLFKWKTISAKNKNIVKIVTIVFEALFAIALIVFIFISYTEMPKDIKYIPMLEINPLNYSLYTTFQTGMVTNLIVVVPLLFYEVYYLIQNFNNTRANNVCVVSNEINNQQNVNKNSNIVNSKKTKIKHTYKLLSIALAFLFAISTCTLGYFALMLQCKQENTIVLTDVTLESSSALILKLYSSKEKTLPCEIKVEYTLNGTPQTKTQNITAFKGAFDYSTMLTSSDPENKHFVITNILISIEGGEFKKLIQYEKPNFMADAKTVVMLTLVIANLVALCTFTTLYAGAERKK